MSDQFRTERSDSPPPPSVAHPSLVAFPEWLARRLLRPGEEITWVRGPWLNPSWERYVTHPGLFLVALGLGGFLLAFTALISGGWGAVPAPLGLLAGGIVLASVYVLGIASGYFTRLVVTNTRLFIVQGYEVRHSWNINDLPISMLRYGRRGIGGADPGPSIDLDAVQTMLGSSTQFTDAKTIQAFSKQLNRMRDRGTDRR
jgi:hypothetical protein